MQIALGSLLMQIAFNVLQLVKFEHHDIIRQV
jgi:hypothetical protein